MAGFAERIWLKVTTWPTWLKVVLWLAFPYVLGLVFIWRSSWPQRPKWVATGVVVVGAAVLVIPAAVDQDDRPSRSATSVGIGERAAGTSYSQLSITKVVYEPPVVVVQGTTDLPDAARLNVTFNVPTKPDDLYIGVDHEVSVSRGMFSVSLEPPQRKEFESGPYIVEVLFTPRGQPSEVVAAVGGDGERLTGPLVEESSFGFNLLRVRERPDLSLQIDPAKYPFERSASFERNSPEYAVALFAEAWRRRDWQAMVRATQITWAETENSPERTLRDWYGIKTLLGFEVVRATRNSPVSVDVTFRVWYEAITNQVEEHHITGRVLRESAPHRLDATGTWGVNPVSTLREE